MSRILIGGYYGFNNCGDEAVLAGLIKGLREAHPGIEIAALSANPDKTREIHGITAINRTNLSSIINYMRKSDLFLFGGGSLVQDTTSIKSPLYYLALLTLARLIGLPFMLIAQGIGPLNRRFIRKLTGFIFNFAESITVRDDNSAKLLKTIKVKKDAKVTADLAFLLNPDYSPRVSNWISANIPENKKIVCVSLRPWNSVSETAMQQTITVIKMNPEIFPVFLPMQPDIDSEISNEMLKKTGGALIDFLPTPAETIALISRCQAVISMRLHTLIMATIAGIPSIGIIYDPKIVDFATQTNIPVVEINNIMADKINDYFSSLVIDEKSRIHQMNAAKSNIDTISVFLNREKK